MEITLVGINAGDLLILDGNRLRLITIVSDSSDPKIYDIFDMTSVSGYPNLSINDFWYDRGSELSNGVHNVIGSGKMYFVTSANTVFRITPQAVSGTSVTSAQIYQYPFTDTVFSGTVRIALTPAGLLVTQPNKNRILKVSP